MSLINQELVTRSMSQIKPN